MSHEMTVNNYIRQNDWKGLTSFLKTENGFIHGFGGRCIGGKYVEFDGFSDFHKICWKIFKLSIYRNFSNRELQDISNTIIELDRIYNETQTKLKTKSAFVKFSTALHDCRYQTCIDGRTSIDRLKECIVNLEQGFYPFQKF